VTISNIKRNILFAVILIFTISCANKNKITDKQKEDLSVEELYNKASMNLSNGLYDDAIDLFSKISQEYPYSNLAVKSEVMEAYSFYIKKDYDMVEYVADDFVKLHPASIYIPYILYLKTLSYYEQIKDTDHDQKITNMAKDSAINLINRFPNSNYARDLKFKLQLMNDHLAGEEMSIARFYMRKGEILAAIKRFTVIIDKYQTTSHIEEALFRLVELYLKLGVKTESKKYASILGYNYPNSKWYHHAYQLISDIDRYVIKHRN
jgi:outer membrane protein assembly factor BamD